jgi:hypothetical protein
MHRNSLLKNKIVELLLTNKLPWKNYYHQLQNFATMGVALDTILWHMERQLIRLNIKIVHTVVTASEVRNVVTETLLMRGQ